VYTNHLFIE